MIVHRMLFYSLVNMCSSYTPSKLFLSSLGIETCESFNYFYSTDLGNTRVVVHAGRGLTLHVMDSWIPLYVGHCFLNKRGETVLVKIVLLHVVHSILQMPWVRSAVCCSWLIILCLNHDNYSMQHLLYLCLTIWSPNIEQEILLFLCLISELGSQI